MYQNGKSLLRASVSRKNTKGKIEGRSIAINNDVQKFITQYVQDNSLKEDDYLFYSRKGGRISRKHAWLILNKAYNKSKLTGKLSTHTLRKTMALNSYVASGKDILKVQKILGQKSLSSTTSYLSADQEEVDALTSNMNLFETV